MLALGVLLFHYGCQYFPFDLPLIKTLIIHSSFRVSFFFFISGFVMALVYGQKPEFTSWDFYIRRLSRIAPLYLIAFVLTLILVLFVKHAAPKGLIIVLHVLGLQSWYPGYVLDLNFTTWSISVELAFYVCFPFLIRWMRNKKVSQVLIATIVFWLLQSLQHIVFVEWVDDGSKVREEFISSFPLWHMPTFFSGMTTAWLIVSGVIPEAIRRNGMMLFFLGIILLMLLISIPNPILKYIHNGLLSPVFAFMIVGLYFDRSLLHRVLSAPLISKLGDLSYGIFIFQYPVWVLQSWIFDAQSQPTTWYFYVYLTAVLLFSFLMNRFAEKPLRDKWREASG